MNRHKKLWLLFCISGLIIIGAGLCLFGEALSLKMEHAETSSWFWWGTASLVFINSGVSFFGNGIKYRMYYENYKKEGKLNQPIN